MGFPIFRTRSVPANQRVLYQIRLCAPIISSLELSTYTFPLSPTSLRMERSSMSSYADTQAPGLRAPLTQGVTRVMDIYGLAPPIITIEGTTGWDLHSADGYSLTGLQSMQQLAAFLAEYADLNQVNRIAGIPYPFKLEFYDYFTSNFWQIEPIGPQIFQQDSTRPLLVYYRFRWAATIPAGGIADVLDEIGDVLDVGSQLAASSLGQSIGSTLSNFTPTGPSPSASNIAVGPSTA
jgi:hypothetical protein